MYPDFPSLALGTWIHRKGLQVFRTTVFAIAFLLALHAPSARASDSHADLGLAMDILSQTTRADDEAQSLQQAIFLLHRKGFLGKFAAAIRASVAPTKPKVDEEAILEKFVPLAKKTAVQGFRLNPFGTEKIHLRVIDPNPDPKKPHLWISKVTSKYFAQSPGSYRLWVVVNTRTWEAWTESEDPTSKL